MEAKMNEYASIYLDIIYSQLDHNVGGSSHDGAGQRPVPVLHHGLHHRYRARVAEAVHLLGEALHRGGPPLPAQHLVAGKLVLEDAVLAAADLGLVGGVEQVVGLVLQLLDVQLPRLLAADKVGRVVRAPAQTEQPLLLQ